MSSCADSLRNELGMRNRLYPDEYPTHSASEAPTPFDTPDPKTGKTELQRLVDEIRRTVPPARDQSLAASAKTQAGEKLFAEIGCATCHVATYKTLPPGTRINGGTYKVPKFIGNKVIHPPVVTSYCTMSGQETASPKLPNRSFLTNPQQTNSALRRSGACAFGTT